MKVMKKQNINKIDEIHTTTLLHLDNKPLNVSFPAAVCQAWDGLHNTVSSVSAILPAQ